MNIGDIVTFRSHPFFYQADKIIIAGDASPLPPLMVITEIAEILKKGKSRSSLLFRCYWYSTKGGRFESTWLEERDIKLISNSESIDLNQLQEGDLVQFLTTDIESKKFKCYSTYESSQRMAATTSLNSLLSFVCPNLVYLESVGTPASESEKKGLKKSPAEIKVKWYNPVSEKYSETTLPSSCIRSVPKTTEITLKAMAEVIESKKCVIIEIDSKETLFEPLYISNQSGSYQVSGIDLLRLKQGFFHLNDQTVLKPVDKVVLSSAPEFDFSKSIKPSTTVISLLKKSIKENKIVRLKYVAPTGKISVRCVANLKLYELKEKGKPVVILEGFCYKKQSVRHFNIKRIESAEQLDFGY